LVLLERGKSTIHLGNYTDYRLAQQAGIERAMAKAAEPRSTDDVLRIRQTSSKPDKSDSKAQRKQRKQLKELEVQIEDIEEILEGVEAQFASVAPSDFTRLQELKGTYDGLKADLSAMYEEWERLAEELAVP